MGIGHSQRECSPLHHGEVPTHAGAENGEAEETDEEESTQCEHKEEQDKRRMTRRPRMIKRPADDTVWSLVEGRKEKRERRLSDERKKNDYKDNERKKNDYKDNERKPNDEKIKIIIIKMDMNNYKYIITMLIIMSLNVNGLRNIGKINNVFAASKRKHSYITFLQETFWDDKFIENYKHLWEGDNILQIIIIITEDCRYTFTFDSCDNEGRILKVACNIVILIYTLQIK